MTCTNLASGLAARAAPWLRSAVAQARDAWYARRVRPVLESLAIEEETMRSRVTHPYIDKHPDYRGGRAIIVGTDFPVSSVAIYILRHGMLPEELIRRFPHLTLAQISDALSYYDDHQAEIDTEMQRNLSEDADAAQLPRGEILSLRYDPATDRFVIQSLRRLNADSK